MLVQITFNAEIDDGFVETLKAIVGHHMEYLIDLDENPEIHSIYNASLTTKLEEEIALKTQHTYNVGFYNCVDNCYDATQFDVESMTELDEVFQIFCLENGMPRNTPIDYIERADDMEVGEWRDWE